jgi:hypothetical protein
MDDQMPGAPIGEFLGKSVDLRPHFAIERASDFQKSPFSPTQVSAIFFARKK